MWILPKLLPEEILVYLRKSRTDDPTLTVEEVLSKHEQMLDEWVARNLSDVGKIPEKNRYREVVSGETLDSRPRVMELLREVESPKHKAVLIVEPQRLSRGDLEDIGRLVKVLRYSNTIVITLQYTYDLRDERDRDLFERELKRGNEFLEYQKRIMNNGRLLSVSNGNFVGNKAPYGYRRVQVKEGKRTCWTLEPVPEEAKVVNMIFEMYASGDSAHQVARNLNSMGIPTATGTKWGAESIKPILSNVHYLGKVRWNHRKTVKIIEDGEVVTTRPRSTDVLIYPGKHPAIVSQELWDSVQEIRGKHAPVKSKARHVNPFAGLLYCKCGRIMSRRQYRNNGVERSAPRLLCDGQTDCGTASCTVEEMTVEVIKVLKEAIQDFEIRIENSAEDSIALHEQLVTQLEKRLEALNKQELSQWDKYTREGMPKHIFDQLNEKVLREKEEVQQALCTAKDAVPERVDYTQKKATFSRALELLQDPDAPVREKNLLLKECIERIEYSRYRGKRYGLRWTEPEPIELDVHLRV